MTDLAAPPVDRCTFKDLCIDSDDVTGVTAFWSAALGLTATDRGDVVLLADGVAAHAVWLNRVPEARTVKNRVHLDLHVAAVADLVDLGASVLDDSLPWTVLAAPDGSDLCAFVRAPDRLPDYRLYELVVDSADPAAVAGWWAARFGVAARTEPGEDVWYLSGADGMPWEIVFGAVPEPKTVKNRVHWDVLGDTAGLLAAGATLLRAHDDEISWDVLADPEGNEFCVFARG